MIRPSYWTDADLQTRLTADVREFYIGCWMVADDAGYIEWDVDRIGVELYGYHPLAWRRSRLPKWLALLSLNGHLVMLPCGRHVVVPNLTKYQAPPKPSYQNKKAHDACLRQVAPAGTSGRHGAPSGKHDLVAPSGATGDQRAPAQGFYRGSIGEGFSRGAAADSPNGTDPGENGDLKAALGDFAVMIGGKAS